MEKLLLLGDQSIALGAIHAGISGVYAYPGTPSTEITEYIQDSPLAQERSIHSKWCTNEKTAMEAALGMSYIGKRALVCMKHVGLNVAADAFVNSAMTGTNGGLVVLVADDPSMHSSQNEQDSRYYGKFAFTPILEPSSQQEAYDMIRYAFDLSEESELPVLMRITTRMAHSRAVVKLAEARAQNQIKFPEDRSRWVLLPVNARRRYLELLAAQPVLEELAYHSPYNKYQAGNKQGVITCGIGYNYLMENFPEGCDRTVLKISQYPLPKDLIRKMWKDCDEILVLEDGQPFVEEQLRGIIDDSEKVKGRLTGEIPRVGELTPDNVRTALGLASEQHFDTSKNIVGRPPALCAGCGHRDVYNALNEVIKEYSDSKVFSDIGCYTLGALPPFRAIDSCVDMGASITMAKGAADGGLFPSIAVIGDSTFTHSGITGLLDAVNSNSNIVVIISDNETTAMTGGQESAGTGRIEAICHGAGVDPEHLHVVVPLPKNREDIKDTFRKEIEYKGVSVIIPRRDCIQAHKKNRKTSKEMNLDIILSGVGGQGILSIAAIIGEASLHEGLNIKQAEVHGMSQRGGDVQSNLRISSDKIYSNLIAKGTADAIISLEPMEALRYIPYLSSEGWIVTNTQPFINIPNYPETEALYSELSSMPNVISIDIDAMTKEVGSPRTANMILLGAASVILGIGQSKLEDAIARIFDRKGKAIVEMNLKAFRIGHDAGEKQIKKA